MSHRYCVEKCLCNQCIANHFNILHFTSIHKVLCKVQQITCWRALLLGVHFVEHQTKRYAKEHRCNPLWRLKFKSFDSVIQNVAVILVMDDGKGPHVWSHTTRKTMIVAIDFVCKTIEHLNWFGRLVLVIFSLQYIVPLSFFGQYVNHIQVIGHANSHFACDVEYVMSRLPHHYPSHGHSHYHNATSQLVKLEVSNPQPHGKYNKCLS